MLIDMGDRIIEKIGDLGRPSCLVFHIAYFPFSIYIYKYISPDEVFLPQTLVPQDLKYGPKNLKSLEALKRGVLKHANEIFLFLNCLPSVSSVSPCAMKNADF